MKTTSKTDWDRIRRMKDDEIDTSDAPEWDAEMFVNAKIKLPERKKTISIRLPSELIDWYKAQGKGYQTRMGAVLRMYMEAQKNQTASQNRKGRQSEK